MLAPAGTLDTDDGWEQLPLPSVPFVRQCRGPCARVLPEDDVHFNADRTTPTGLGTRCRQCRRGRDKDRYHGVTVAMTPTAQPSPTSAWCPACKIDCRGDTCDACGAVVHRAIATGPDEGVGAVPPNAIDLEMTIQMDPGRDPGRYRVLVFLSESLTHRGHIEELVQCERLVVDTWIHVNSEPTRIAMHEFALRMWRHYRRGLRAQ